MAGVPVPVVSTAQVAVDGSRRGAQRRPSVCLSGATGSVGGVVGVFDGL